MRIKCFLAPDMRTALRMVRDEQGPDAVILSNRATPDGIEVVAATDYDEALVTQALRAAAPDLATVATRNRASEAAPARDDLSTGLGARLAELTGLPPVVHLATPAAVEPAPRPVTAVTRPVAAPAEAAVVDRGSQVDPSILAMRQELASMRQLMERQMTSLTIERLRGSPARCAVYETLLGYGCEEVLAQAVAERIDPRLPVAEIQPALRAEFARMLTIARNDPLDEGGIIAVVGPTGAGKTTTVAKIAARYAARNRARDVALITSYSERGGAHEQLHAHGRRLGITVREGNGPSGLQEALSQLEDYPMVLVDTTGYAPSDSALFRQILWLRATRKVRSLLVLPANAHPHDLGEVIRRYRPAAPEAMVLTKLDETGRLGSALSVVIRHGLPLAYTTSGREVSSDIEMADATRVTQAMEKLPRAADNVAANEKTHARA